jgi:hypothetical protein
MFGRQRETSMTIRNNSNPDRDRPDQGLDLRYGKIGIAAVAAALHYRPETKNHVRGAAGDEHGRVARPG